MFKYCNISILFFLHRDCVYLCRFCSKLSHTSSQLYYYFFFKYKATNKMFNTFLFRILFSTNLNLTVQNYSLCTNSIEKRNNVFTRLLIGRICSFLSLDPFFTLQGKQAPSAIYPRKPYVEKYIYIFIYTYTHINVFLFSRISMSEILKIVFMYFLHNFPRSYSDTLAHRSWGSID